MNCSHYLIISEILPILKFNSVVVSFSFAFIYHKNILIHSKSCHCSVQVINLHLIVNFEGFTTKYECCMLIYWNADQVVGISKQFTSLYDYHIAIFFPLLSGQIYTQLLICISVILFGGLNISLFKFYGNHLHIYARIIQLLRFKILRNFQGHRSGIV